MTPLVNAPNSGQHIDHQIGDLRNHVDTQIGNLPATGWSRRTAICGNRMGRIEGSLDILRQFFLDSGRGTAA